VRYHYHYYDDDDRVELPYWQQMMWMGRHDDDNVRDVLDVVVYWSLNGGGGYHF
jgi:hypothetical protein